MFRVLTSKLIHPQIISVLSLCGHGSKILISDANYPLAEKSGTAQKVYLGLRPGQPTVPDVLETILSIANIEKAEVMIPQDDTIPEIFDEFYKLLPGVPFSHLNRYAFYDACSRAEPVVLAISTGEQRTFANILLTIGCA